MGRASRKHYQQPPIYLSNFAIYFLVFMLVMCKFIAQLHALLHSILTYAVLSKMSLSRVYKLIKCRTKTKNIY